jgi:hypothetical protein
MMQYAYFVVEGPHDVEVVGRLLGLRGFRRLKDFAQLDSYWARLVPRTFPIGGDLLRRVNIPVFLDAPNWSVAVHSAIGVEQIGNTIKTSLLALPALPNSLGVLLDADDILVKDRWDMVRETIPQFDCGNAPGGIGSGVPRAGIFVLPDNKRAGTLEDVLLACAQITYPALLGPAQSFVNSLSPSDGTVFVNKSERKDFEKPAGRTKAIAGCIGSVLRPGKSIQVSIQDNQWFRNAGALALPEVKALRDFVDALTI